ncbi:hypothetical protein EGR_07516 [Echinococcus granulosus]|uniref:Uncharacterized protein n=1 Tax=Echinococcus granulosus TaxID=6210 RepID=W6U9F2_ECHGR|nr:hypothetical protein EGR_07516 [Echinococcus granulosus]EUB57640.1 hypothetical protein EGR_07516 [Echinococcus granulosus]
MNLSGWFTVSVASVVNSQPGDWAICRRNVNQAGFRLGSGSLSAATNVAPGRLPLMRQVITLGQKVNRRRTEGIGATGMVPKPRRWTKSNSSALLLSRDQSKEPNNQSITVLRNTDYLLYTLPPPFLENKIRFIYQL